MRTSYLPALKINHWHSGISLIFLIFAYGCGREPVSPAISAPIKAALKAHYNYRMGSYWIYRDSATGTTDSFVVTNVASGSASGGNVQSVYRNALMDYITIAIADYSLSNPGLPPAQWKWTLQQNGLVLQTPVYYNPLFFYPITLGDIEAYQNYQQESDNYYVEKFLFSDTVNGVADSEYIINHFDTSSFTSTFHRDTYYISDSIGIVRMTLYHPANSVNVNWKLLRYSITK